MRAADGVPDVDPDDTAAYLRALRTGDLRSLNSTRPATDPRRHLAEQEGGSDAASG